MRLTDFVVEEEEKSAGTFVGVKFSEESCDELLSIIEQLGVGSPTKREDLHCTVMYSTKELPDLVEDTDSSVDFDPPKIATLDKFHIFQTQDGNDALVLFLKCEYLDDRHSEILETYEAKYPHAEYHPHVTLSYNSGDFDISDYSVKDYAEELEIVNEYIEPIDLDWV